MFPPEDRVGVNTCKSGNFREHFIFANSVKRHVCDVKISRPGMINDRMILPFREGFIFSKLRTCDIPRK